MTRFLLLLAPLLATAACSPSQKMCNKARTCAKQAGSDFSSDDYDDCVDVLEEADEAAADAGCASEYSKAVNCLLSNGSCNDSGGFTLENDNDCLEENADYVECVF